jgi:hypothetical protein
MPISVVESVAESGSPRTIRTVLGPPTSSPSPGPDALLSQIARTCAVGVEHIVDADGDLVHVNVSFSSNVPGPDPAFPLCDTPPRYVVIELGSALGASTGTGCGDITSVVPEFPVRLCAGLSALP